MSALTDITTPADQTEGTRSQVLRWLKAVGDRVSMNEPLVELETDKVTVEIPAPVSGVLAKILRGEGEELAPGDVLGNIETGAQGAQVPEHSAASASPKTAARPQASADATGAARGQLSPAVRRLIAEHAIDVAAITGSGQAGRITAEDVLQAVAARAEPAMAAPAARASESAPVARRVPHSHMRKRIAEHMAQSLLHTAPHVTSVFEADMSAVVAHRRQHQEDFASRGTPLTLSAYFVAAAVDGIRAVPEVNSRWSEDALEIYDSVNIGVAAAIAEGGLIVPVLRAVEGRDLFEIAHGLNDLVTRARGGALTPADLRGGTFTMSNHGTSGSLLAAPIVINQPQSAILGIGKLEKRACVVDEADAERVVVRPKCYVTLTIDHRVLDGHDANRFLQAFVTRLENFAD